MARSTRKLAPEAATTATPPPAAPQSLIDRIVNASKNTSVIVAAVAAVLALLFGMTTQLPAIWKFVSSPFAPQPVVVDPIADIAGGWCVMNTVMNANDQRAKGDKNVFYIELKRVPDTAQFEGSGHKVGANGSLDVPGSELTITPSAVSVTPFQIDFVEQVYKASGALSDVKHPGWFTWAYDQSQLAGSYTIKNGFGGDSIAMPSADKLCPDYIAKSAPAA